MNLAGSKFYKDYKSDLYRMGIILYGLKPDYRNILPDAISPIAEWKSVITMIKNVKAGQTVGYGRSYITDKDTKGATVSTVYTDGLDRLLSNRGSVFITGKKCPIIGKTCMDQFMVDVNEAEACVNDEVAILGKNYTPDDMAKEINTIGYEVISKRVDRIYT